VADLRMPLLAAAGWFGGLSVLVLPWWLGVLVVAALVAGLVVRPRLVGVAVLVTGLAVALVSWLHVAHAARSPVAVLAADGAAVEATVRVTGDARVSHGQYGDVVVLPVTALSVTGRGAAYQLRAPVTVIADPTWRRVPLGATLEVAGRLAPSDVPGVAGVLRIRGSPTLRVRPDAWWRGADRLRSAIRESVTGLPADRAALVPALVDGDDGSVPDDLSSDFRTTGLTHLMAVSGTNLTIVVGCLLALARGCGVRGRGRYVVGALGIAGFVLLARTEPSVLRAAAMGTVGLLGMGVDGRRRGLRALGVASLALLLVDPALSVSWGFALSVVATGGILALGPGLRDALARWLPRWAAEAIAVPTAAQLACTPLVAALSGQVSLVAVVANLLVGPVVAPATVLGLAGGLLSLVWAPVGRLVGHTAGWCVGWIVAVARHGADLPGAAVGWGTGAVSLAVLTGLCVLIAAGAPRVLRRPVTGMACCLLMVAVVLVRPPSPGWPPDGWVFAMCDVGQGDGLVLHAGAATGVVVDTGPDPGVMDTCLDRLGVRRVPLVVLTHFHADHVDGLAGVLAGRAVGEVDVTDDRDPSYGAAQVDRDAAAFGLRPTLPAFGATRRIGAVTLQTLWPPPGWVPADPNDASVVMLATVSGVRILLGGDAEPPSQEGIAQAWPGLRADVLKVPHHGSRYQDPAFLRSLGARLALISVGVDNDYGHPAPETLSVLQQTGAEVLRTDLDGDLVVSVVDGRLGVSHR
jgi:competence protein ComEC